MLCAWAYWLTLFRSAWLGISGTHHCSDCRFPMHVEYQLGLYESCRPCSLRGIDWSLTHMPQCTQFTSRDRTPGLEGCDLAWGTFLIGNLIPIPRNWVSRTVISWLESLRGFCSYLIFPISKIKIKVSGDSKQNHSSSGTDFPKLKNRVFSTHFHTLIILNC